MDLDPPTGCTFLLQKIHLSNKWQVLYKNKNIWSTGLFVDSKSSQHMFLDWCSFCTGLVSGGSDSFSRYRQQCKRCLEMAPKLNDFFILSDVRIKRCVFVFQSGKACITISSCIDVLCPETQCGATANINYTMPTWTLRYNFFRHFNTVTSSSICLMRSHEMFQGYAILVFLRVEHKRFACRFQDIVPSMTTS